MASPVLLAHDLSEACDRAAQRAIWLARRDGRALVVVWVVEDPVGIDMERGERELAELLANQAADIETTLQVRIGAPSEEICEAAKAAGAGLVVVGAHRREWPRALFTGPTATSFDIGVPVLQAHDLSGGPWRNVMVGMDGSRAAQRALDAAITLGRVTPLHLVHVYDVPFAGFITGGDAAAEFAKPRLELLADAVRSAEARGQTVISHLRRGSVIATLDQSARDLNADLLVIGAGGDGGNPFGHIARALTKAPPCDLMVVP